MNRFVDVDETVGGLSQPQSGPQTCVVSSRSITLVGYKTARTSKSIEQ